MYFDAAVSSKCVQCITITFLTTTSPTHFYFFVFVFFLSYFVIFPVLLYLHLDGENREEGAHYIPNSLFILWVALKLVPDGSCTWLRTNKKTPVQILGTSRHYHYTHEERGILFWQGRKSPLFIYKKDWNILSLTFFNFKILTEKSKRRSSKTWLWKVWGKSFLSVWGSYRCSNFMCRSSFKEKLIIWKKL